MCTNCGHVACSGDMHVTHRVCNVTFLPSRGLMDDNALVTYAGLPFIPSRGEAGFELLGVAFVSRVPTAAMRTSVTSGDGARRAACDVGGRLGNGGAPT